MLPASLAAWVPVFMATATSAWARAGASLVPSPVMATRRPPRLVLADELELGLGRGLGEEVVDARLGGDGGRGQRVVAGDHHRLDAHPPQLGEALRMPPLTMSLSWITPSTRAPSATTSGVAALLRDLIHRGADAGRAARPPCVPDVGLDGVGRALADPGAPFRFTPLIRVCAVNGTKCAPSSWTSRSRMPYFSLARTTIAAALGRLVGQRGELGGVGQVALGDALGGEERGGLAVAERDRAGLVQEQHVDVAGRLDRPAATWRSRSPGSSGPCRRCRWRRGARRSWSGSGRRAGPPGP